MVSSFKNLGSIRGNIDDRTLTWFGSVSFVLAGIAKIIWASLVDIYGFKKIFSIVLALQILMATSIYYLVEMNQWLYMICVFISFIC